MAVRFVEKNDSGRVKSATGAYGLNLLRARVLDPLLPFFAGLATDDRVPGAVRGMAKAQLLDGIYTTELARQLGSPNGTSGE
jgi:hypothetical protein